MSASWLVLSVFYRFSGSFRPFKVLHNDDGENFLMLLDGYKSASWLR